MHISPHVKTLMTQGLSKINARSLNLKNIVSLSILNASKHHPKEKKENNISFTEKENPKPRRFSEWNA